MVFPLHTDTVVLLRRQKTGVDDYGVPTYTIVQVQVDGVSVQPVMSMEQPGQTSDMVTDQWRLFGPPDMPLTAGDRVGWDGLDLQVDGTPMQWTQLLPHTECLLKRYGG